MKNGSTPNRIKMHLLWLSCVKASGILQAVEAAKIDGVLDPSR